MSDQIKETGLKAGGAGDFPFQEVGAGRLDRRNFIGKMLIGTGVVLAVESFVATFAFLASKPRGEKKPVNVPKAKLKPGMAYQIIYGGKPAVVMTDEKGNIWVRCIVCTHLGCIVKYCPENNDFHCPCHDGFFDAKGKPIAGPPPLPLEEIPFKDKGSFVVVGGE
jgi:cytochrome b6-f complex iron-sulfur subunit